MLLPATSVDCAATCVSAAQGDGSSADALAHARALAERGSWPAKRATHLAARQPLLRLRTLRAAALYATRPHPPARAHVTCSAAVQPRRGSFCSACEATRRSVRLAEIQRERSRGRSDFRLAFRRSCAVAAASWALRAVKHCGRRSGWARGVGFGESGAAAVSTLASSLLGSPFRRPAALAEATEFAGLKHVANRSANCRLTLRSVHPRQRAPSTCPLLNSAHHGACCVAVECAFESPSCLAHSYLACLASPAHASHRTRRRPR